MHHACRAVEEADEAAIVLDVRPKRRESPYCAAETTFILEKLK
jgi:hypothetical protein